MLSLGPDKIRSLIPQLDAERLDVELYRQAGVFVLRRALPADIVAQWQKAWRKFYAPITAAGRRVNPFNPVVVNEPPPPELANIHRYGKLLDIAEAVHGRDIGFYLQRLLIKDQHSRGPVFLHHDFPYNAGRPDKTLVFIPLDPANSGNGGLVFYPGTQGYGYLGDAGEINNSGFKETWTPIRPSLEPGDVVLMHPFTWHESGPHNGGSDRATVQVFYQPANDPSCIELMRGQWQTEIFFDASQPEHIFRRSRTTRLRELQAEVDGKQPKQVI